MARKNNDNVINILEEHKVYKKEYDDGWFYFGEMNEKKKPMNIGLFFCKKYDSYGTFMMMENVVGKFDGEGMCIVNSPKGGTSSVGYCYDGKPMGPQLICDKKGNLCYCLLNESGNKVGFAVDIKSNKYTIYQCFEDGSVGYKCVTFEDCVLYFEDARRREDNKYSRIFKDNQNYTFKHERLQIDDFDDKKAIMPTRVVKKDAKHFVVSGGVQAYKEGNRIKSNYVEYFKELNYDESFPSGYGIKYYDNAYFFGQFNKDGKREKVGCLRKDKNAFMGNFVGDILYGPVLTVEDSVPRLCSYYNGKKNGTYFEFQNDYLLIKSRNKDKDNNIAYRIHLYTFIVEEIDLDTSTILHSASYPFEENDPESLRQESERNAEVNLLNSLGLNYEDYEELENFNYVIENNQIKIISLKKSVQHLSIPKCAKILAPNAFADESLCGDILSVNVKDGVVEIGEDSFVGCKKLAKITMGQSVKEIKKGAFKGSLDKYIVFANSTKMIRTGAFADCENLREVYVADDCVIEEGSFPEWTRIITRKDQHKRIKKTIRNGNPFYKAIDFVLGVFKKKEKKRKLTPGEEKEIKEKIQKEKKNKSKKVKEKKVKKEIKKRTKVSFGERIQDILRIIALPFIYIAKCFAWLFGAIFRWLRNLFKGIRGFLADIEITKEHVLMALPFILLLGYTIFAFIYGVDKLEDLSVTKLIYGGYDWELSGLASNWMEETDHNFFTALTLGLIQIILIVIGFILDIILVIFIFVLGLILAIIAGILKFIVMELLPLAILVIYLVMLKFVSSSNKGLVVTCIIFSLIVGVAYYVVLLGI